MTNTICYHDEAGSGFQLGHDDTGKISWSEYQIIQEREVSYRFYPHFHPYVGQLMGRLLRGGTSGLQAADTEYTAHNESLPDSIQVDLVHEGIKLTIPKDARIALLSDTTAMVEGTLYTVPAKVELTLGSNTPASPTKDGMRVTLLDGMVNTPLAGAGLTLKKDQKAVVFGHAKIVLPRGLTALLPAGKKATLEAVTTVLLADGTQITFPEDTEVTVYKSKRRPITEFYAEFFNTYEPTELVQRPYPVKDLDFTSSGAYSVYNWELFYHVPLTIAIHLSKNQRFAEAQRWFHYLFDPTDDSDGPTPERFWKVRPFQYTDVRKIEEILVNLSPSADPDLQTETIYSIDDWKRSAVPPARHRPLPPAGLHVQDGDGLPGQPDRLGRLALPPGHGRGHQRGADALRAGRQHPRAAAAACAARRAR